MVEGEAKRDCRTDLRAPGDRDDPVDDPADGEDRCLGWVDDRGEGIDAVHAQVRDRECAARNVLRTESPGTGRVDELVPARGELLQVENVGVVDDRDHEPVLERDGDADVNAC